MVRSLYVNEAAVKASLKRQHDWLPADILDHAYTTIVNDICQAYAVDQVGSIVPPDALLLTDLEEAPEDADYVSAVSTVLVPGPELLIARPAPETESREVQGIPARKHYIYRWALQHVSPRDAQLYARNGLIPSISAINRHIIEEADRADPPQPRPLPQEGITVIVQARPAAAYRLVDASTEAEFIEDLRTATRLGFDTETTFVPGWPENPEKKAVRKRWDEVVGISVSTQPGKGWYLEARKDRTSSRAGAQTLIQALEDPSLPKVGHNLPFDLQALQHTFGIEVAGPLHDTQVMCWLLGHQTGHQGLKARAWEDLGVRMIEYDELARGRDMGNIPPAEIAPYAGADAEIPLRLMDLYMPQLKAKSLMQAYALEQRVVRILHKLSYKGMYVDIERLQALAPAIEAEIEQLEARSFPGINIRSSLQLPPYLYRTLGYRFSDPTKRKANGLFSTDKETIKRLLFDYPGDQMLMDLLRIRELRQLNSGFIQKLPRMVNPTTGRIHCAYNTTRTRTTRLTASSPNLQQIPARSTLGRAIRDCFRGQDGTSILVADLSQIEVRYMAHVTRSPFLVNVFENDLDLYRELASRFYKLDSQDVTKAQRQYGKVIGLGTQFGAGGYKLSLSTIDPLADPPFMIPPDEAERLQNIYLHQEAPEIPQYMRSQVQYAKEHGYVTTALGYRRDLPDINSYDFALRAAAERQANNTPIQGGAAEVLKSILVKCEDEGILDYIVANVHDEVVAEGTEAELRDLQPLLIHCMETAYPLSVPIKAEAGIADSWASAKD